MVTPAAMASGCNTPSAAAVSAPYTSYTIRTMPNAPAFTTATACSSALTGAGATMALGSQPCSGTIAAFTPRPSMNSRKMICSSTTMAGGQRLEDAALLEHDRTGQAVQPHHREQQHCASDQSVGEIDLPAAQSLFRPAMHDQRIRRDREQLVEREEGDQVGRQRDAGGGGDAQG